MVSSTAKLAALALAAALLLQPLAASAACGQAAATPGACPGGCPAAQPGTPAVPANVHSAAPACCEISSPAPTPRAAVVKGTETLRPLVVAVATPAVIRSEAPTAPVGVTVAAPRVLASSLHTLYCVFLI